MLYQSLLVLEVLVSVGLCYQAGPPVNNQLCTSMAPSTMTYSGHGAQPSTDDAPYHIIASSNCYGAAGQTITVTVMSRTDSSPACPTIAGLMLQAKTSDTGAENYGTWSTMQQSELKLMDCFSVTDSALSHAERLDHQTVTVTWTPPTTNGGTLKIFGTVVKEQATYWVAHESAEITFDASCDGNTPTMQTPQACGNTQQDTTLNSGGGGDNTSPTSTTTTTTPSSTTDSSNTATTTTTHVLAYCSVLVAVLCATVWYKAAHGH